MGLLTLPQTIKIIRQKDSGNAVNSAMLLALIENNQLPCGNRGVRTVVELSAVITVLNNMLGFNDSKEIPMIRSIRRAAVELKQMKGYLSFGEDYIRKCVADDKIRYITIGNRHYIALQSFKEKYSENFVYGRSPGIRKKDIIKQGIAEQMKLYLSNHSNKPKVIRIRTK